MSEQRDVVLPLAVDGEGTPSSSAHGDVLGAAAPTMREFLDVLRGYPVGGYTGQGSVRERGNSAMTEFSKMNPPTFDDAGDPRKAESWLKRVGNLLDALKVPQEERVSIVTLQLEGEASNWWEAKKATRNEGEWTWKAFEEAFLDKYFPKAHKKTLRREFF